MALALGVGAVGFANEGLIHMPSSRLANRDRLELDSALAPANVNINALKKQLAEADDKNYAAGRRRSYQAADVDAAYRAPFLSRAADRREGEMRERDEVVDGLEITTVLDHDSKPPAPAPLLRHGKRLPVGAKPLPGLARMPPAVPRKPLLGRKHSLASPPMSNLSPGRRPLSAFAAARRSLDASIDKIGAGIAANNSLPTIIQNTNFEREAIVDVRRPNDNTEAAGSTDALSGFDAIRPSPRSPPLSHPSKDRPRPRRNHRGRPRSTIASRDIVADIAMPDPSHLSIPSTQADAPAKVNNGAATSHRPSNQTTDPLTNDNTIFTTNTTTIKMPEARVFVPGLRRPSFKDNVIAELERRYPANRESWRAENRNRSPSPTSR